jgi:hypothetical protein
MGCHTFRPASNFAPTIGVYGCPLACDQRVPVCQREEDVGHETGLGLHLQDARAQVFGQVLQFRYGVARDGSAHVSFSFRWF